MSLINRTAITAILLADGWHIPDDEVTFSQFAIARWLDEPGFTFKESGVDVSGPIASILAVKH